MTSRDFCYWLQGYFEVGHVATEGMTPAQVECVAKHLAMVFVHEIDPSMPSAKLDEIHAPKLTKPGKPPPIGGEGPGGVLYRC